MSVFEGRAEIVRRLFRDVVECDGQEFGKLSSGVLGISDDRDGVQWNAAYDRYDRSAWLGVNLEGKEYDDWPIARLIERELSHPLLLAEYRPRVARPDMVEVVWTREAWQFGNRVAIRESRLAPTPITLDQLDGEGWATALRHARECLNPQRQHRGRRRATVTLLRSGRMVERWVTPHLQCKTRFAEDSLHSLRRAKANLDVIHEFVACQARP